MTLFRRKSRLQTQDSALVKAPSADLIRGDNELVIPEPREIQCEIPMDKFSEYTILAKYLEYFPPIIFREEMLWKLKLGNFCYYDPEEVRSFMDRQAMCLGKTTRRDLIWDWRRLDEYKKPLPLGVLKKLNKIKDNIEGIQEKTVFFWITDIQEVPQKEKKERQEICFLKLDGNSGYPPKPWRVIIDAWRGPTFSDEEAKI
ncbi:MAG: hypothetical protein HYT62_01660 [Candidatus Yanofskybacteria bacterium]|nr:hypothetical protein [Candidatus Yanofskybacteria bacterium]